MDDHKYGQANSKGIRNSANEKCDNHLITKQNLKLHVNQSPVEKGKPCRRHFEFAKYQERSTRTRVVRARD